MLPDRGTYDLSPDFKYWVTMVYALFPLLNRRLFAPLWGSEENKSSGPKINNQVWSIVANGNGIRRYQREKARLKEELTLNDSSVPAPVPNERRPARMYRVRTACSVRAQASVGTDEEGCVRVALSLHLRRGMSSSSGSISTTAYGGF